MMTSFDMKKSEKRMEAFPKEKPSPMADLMIGIRRFAGWMAVCSLALTVLYVFEEILIGPPLLGWQFFLGEFVAEGAIWLVIKSEEKHIS